MTTTVVLIRDTDMDGADRTRDVHDLFAQKVKEAGLQNEVQVVRAADLGIYNKGIVAKILPEGIVYAGIADADLDDIVTTTLAKKTPVSRLLYRGGNEQVRIVMRNCGIVNPESIEDYVMRRGYQGIKRALYGLTPEKAIEEMKTSGLRGRGGAGYPTWLKWSLARNAFGDRKFVICNGDEGDPGAYMDRSVLEGDPHSVIEGMMIAA